MNAHFLKRIREKNFSVAVVGLGYVGLPLALEFAKKGITVFGVEIDADRIKNLRKKVSYISDVTDKELKGVLRKGFFKPADTFAVLKECDVVIICVPTPLKRKYHPDISYIKQAVKSISVHMKKGSLVILESTTYPGTTDEIILPLLEEHNRKHGVDFYLCFSPERIDPGNKLFPVHKIPKVVGGIDAEASALGAAVYKNIIEKVVMVSSARVAEVVKLLENTFRLINIGLINEMAMMAHKMKVDIWEVVDAAATKPFGFMPFYPGPGVGGHCIPKDPLYLYWKAKHYGFISKFIKLASNVISFMPEYVVGRVEHTLEGKGRALEGARVLVLGATYKKDIKDLRKSPAIDVIETLIRKRAKVSFYDPIIPYLKMKPINLVSAPLTAQALKSADCVIIATDHTTVDYQLVLKEARYIFDARNVYKNVRNEKIERL